MGKFGLKELYKKQAMEVVGHFLKLDNRMAVPSPTKVVLNVGIKSAASDGKWLQHVSDGLAKIAGQKPVVTLARKSIAGFKIRQGMKLGIKVTMRGDKMWAFLEQLFNVVLPRVKDFRGIKRNFDGNGNYNLGLKECIVFPVLEEDFSDKPWGLNITICTNAKTDTAGCKVLEALGAPFVRS